MIEYKPTNREKSMAATKDKFWCSYCDRALRGEYGRCPSCGRKHNPKKKKGSK